MNFFSIDYIIFEIGGYSMSYIEFFGTLAGGIAVWLSAQGNKWGWPIGLINVILFSLLCFQVQLYPDLFLQVFFFFTNLIGWWRWTNPTSKEQDDKKELKISVMPSGQRILYLLVGGLAIFAMGHLVVNLHVWLPTLFKKPSSFPYLDSLVTVMSILATFMMIQKKIECWVVWIVVDVVATGIYFAKNIKFVSLEYLVFSIIAVFGLLNWSKIYTSYSVKTAD